MSNTVSEIALINVKKFNLEAINYECKNKKTIAEKGTLPTYM